MDVFSEPIDSEYDVNCYTDGYKINEQVGAGIVVKSSPSKGGLNHNEAFHLDKHNTVLQAEGFSVEITATFLLDNKIEGSKIMINCDSQAAIRAINSTVIKNSTTLEATMALNTLGESNVITLRWIPAHCGYEGNELADQFAKRGSNNDRATRIKLPMPRCACYAALRRKTIVSRIESYKLNPPKMFNILWRDKFFKDLIRMNKRDVRAATQILTGHAFLNYHLSRLSVLIFILYCCIVYVLIVKVSNQIKSLGYHKKSEIKNIDSGTYDRITDHCVLYGPRLCR